MVRRLLYNVFCVGEYKTDDTSDVFRVVQLRLGNYKCMTATLRNKLDEWRLKVLNYHT